MFGRDRRGFTLIEVMLSVAILATLAMLSAKSIQQGVKAKVKIQGQIDDVSKMRDALRLIQRDVQLAYHYRDIDLELQTLIQKQGTGSAGGNNGVPPAGGATTPTPQGFGPPREAPKKDPVTNFVGTDEQMSFVTMNNTRMIRNTRQADFVEVGYALKNCKSTDGKHSSKCLWRRASTTVDDDVTIGGDEVVLLEDVTEFKLQYIGKGKQDWVKEWRTDAKSSDSVTKFNFPWAVKISLTVTKGEGNAKKKYSMEIVAAVHFPNNKEDQNGSSNSNNSTPPLPQ